MFRKRSALVTKVLQYGGREKLYGGDALMQQTISREEQKVQDRQPTTKSEPSADDVYARGMSKRSHFQPVAEASGGLLGIIYEGFLGMPVPVVLTVLWLGGLALLGSCVLMLYALATLMA
jgi:hypothetical protein